MSGDYKPGLADLAVYSALRSMEGLTTLTDVLENTSIRPWYDRMQACIPTSSGVYVSEELGDKPTAIAAVEQS